MSLDLTVLNQQVQNLILTVEQLKQEVADLKKSPHLSADEINKVRDADFQRAHRKTKGLR